MFGICSERTAPRRSPAAVVGFHFATRGCVHKRGPITSARSAPGLNTATDGKRLSSALTAGRSETRAAAGLGEGRRRTPSRQASAHAEAPKALAARCCDQAPAAPAGRVRLVTGEVAEIAGAALGVELAAERHCPQVLALRRSYQCRVGLSRHGGEVAGAGRLAEALQAAVSGSAHRPLPFGSATGPLPASHAGSPCRLASPAPVRAGCADRKKGARSSPRDLRASVTSGENTKGPPKRTLRAIRGVSSVA
jgi:hypothetical protein